MYTVSQKATRPHLGKGRSEVKKQGLLISAEMLSGEGAASTASSFFQKQWSSSAWCFQGGAWAQSSMDSEIPTVRGQR